MVNEKKLYYTTLIRFGKWLSMFLSIILIDPDISDLSYDSSFNSQFVLSWVINCTHPCAGIDPFNATVAMLEW
jgi:hypothetical protein